MTRTHVNVYESADKKLRQVALPTVFKAPIRSDLVSFIFKEINKNARQPHAVSKRAGHQTSAESWGTGRAVARIPRRSGGGSIASGQGAFGNMCRGGHMFAPKQLYRKWQRKTNTTQRRHAIASAIAATGSAPLVTARGHRVEKVAEFPIVAPADIEKFRRTKEAVQFLKGIGLGDDIVRCIKSKTIRPGIGKIRNRRHVMRKGPLVVYGADDQVRRAFRNIPGVDVVHVDRLSVLDLAPGSKCGRAVVYTEQAVERLAKIFGTFAPGSSSKSGYVLQKSCVAFKDLRRIINCDQVQSMLLPVHLKTSRVKLPRRNVPAVVAA